MSLKKLIDAAKREDWDYVDRQIPRAVTDSVYVHWAHSEGLDDPDGNVRDLAVSILEKAPMSEAEFARVEEKLHSRMTSDDNQYVRFRSAFAFAAHDSARYREEVVSTLRKAAEDPDVAELAKGYLAKMEE